MQSDSKNKSKKRLPLLARGFAALCAGLIIAAGGSAAAAPTLTVLNAFKGSDGAASGNLYGTAAKGGAAARGVVFKLSPSGILTVLHSFHGYPSDGSYPKPA
ncbi:MAG: hypothetical protein J2P49_10675 [Methylocapsa sp.]|nr:hypothetical protein [Methylocapsa sp.]